MGEKKRIMPPLEARGKKQKKGRGVGSGGAGMDNRDSLAATIVQLLDSTPLLQRLEILKLYCSTCGEKYCKHRR